MLTLTQSNGHSPIIITANGPVSLRDVKKTMISITDSNRESGVIWDMRKAELGTFSCRDMKDVAETIPTMLSKESLYRVAIIGHGILQFGLFRVFQAYAECSQLKREYEYFVDPIEANEWVRAYRPIQAGTPGQSENLALSA